jgi:hypothetical protein
LSGKRSALHLPRLQQTPLDSKLSRDFRNWCFIDQLSHDHCDVNSIELRINSGINTTSAAEATREILHGIQSSIIESRYQFDDMPVPIDDKSPHR